MGYAFGDTSLAAKRLRLLAETFAEPSRVFMREAADRHLGLAADLGCGPGYTTHLLADTLFPRHTVGLDNSESFVGLARSTASETVSFRLHDIKTEPFPSAPYDLLFSRFVLTHLPSPETIVDLWGRQLNVHGLLLLEEVEHIDTSNFVFDSYINIQQAMLAEQDNILYIGSRLDQIADSVSLKRQFSEVRTVTVPAGMAAVLFLMNLGVWRDNDYVRGTCKPAELDELESGLAAIASGHGDTGPVEWRLRHIVMEQVCH